MRNQQSRREPATSGRRGREVLTLHGAGAALLALLACTGLALADECRGAALPAPEIAVRGIGTAEPPIDRTHNVNDLTRRAREAGSAHGSLSRVLGLTTSRFEVVVQALSLRSLPQDGGICAAPAEIRIDLRVDQEVFVVHAEKAHPCWDRRILEHEMQHVRFNNEAVTEAAKDLETRLRRNARPRHYPDLEAAGESVKNDLQAQLSAATEKALAKARRNHARIDRPQTYVDVQRECLAAAARRLRDAQAE
jgi:hypothetical protein